MYRTATLAVYDVMDEVFVTADVRLYDAFPEHPSEIEVHCQTTISGVGSGDGRAWLRDALVGLIEAL
jgi:hypothetical protein